MESILIPDIFRSIVYYLNFRDLINLMSMSIEFRNYIGKSDIWKYLGITIDNKLEPLALGIFKDFIKLDIFKFVRHYVGIRLYYSDSYYLYTIKKYFRNLKKDKYNLYDLCCNKDLNKLVAISESLFEKDAANYYELSIKMAREFNNINNINNSDKNKILEMIYLENYSHYTTKLSKYHICYKNTEYIICYDSNMCFISITKLDYFRWYRGKELLLKLKDISIEFNINSDIFIRVIIILIAGNDKTHLKNINDILYYYN